MWRKRGWTDLNAIELSWRWKCIGQVIVRKVLWTRLHSSGMRTARLLTVSQHALCRGGVPGCGGCTCLAGGCTCPGGTCRGVYLPGWGVYLLGGVPAGGVPAQGVPARRGCTCWGCTCWGVYLPGDVSQHAMGQAPLTPLWTEWLTDRCKNITFTNFVCGR